MSTATETTMAEVEVMEPITYEEGKRFTELEAVVQRGREAFFEVGVALAEIHEKRLYRSEYPSFQDYLDRKWKLGRSYAYRLIEAAGAVKSLPAEVSPIVNTESKAREVAKVPVEKREAVVRKAQQKAKAKGKAPTAKDIKEAKVEVMGSTSTTTHPGGCKIIKHFDPLTPFSEASNDEELAEIMRLKYPKACSNLKTDAGFFSRTVEDIKEYKAWRVIGFSSFEDFCREKLGRTIDEVEQIIGGVRSMSGLSSGDTEKKSGGYKVTLGILTPCDMAEVDASHIKSGIDEIETRFTYSGGKISPSHAKEIAQKAFDKYEVFMPHINGTKPKRIPNTDDVILTVGRFQASLSQYRAQYAYLGPKNTELEGTLIIDREGYCLFKTSNAKVTMESFLANLMAEVGVKQ